MGQSVPTWSENIACILYTRCTSCHNPAGIAPFSLVDYADASGAAAGIQDAVSGNRMPPWPPDAGYRSFAHERNLSSVEKQLILDWVSNGTPLGNLANAPAPPVYLNAEVIQNPDLTATIPTFTIPPISQDLYRCFVVPANTSIDQYMTAIEVVPGNRQVVHHVLVYQDTAATTIQLDTLDPLPGYTSFGGVGSNTAKLIGAWVPGAEPNFLPTGMGVPIPAGTNIILQIHYPVGSSFQQDSTKVKFLLTPNPSTRIVTVAPILNHSVSLTNGPLFIPADSVKTFYGQQATPINVTLLAIAPHMHLIGTSIKAYAVTLALDTIPLINIPSWDFHWQGAYHFRKPVAIPAFSSFRSEAVYDNTSNNLFNPNIPPQDVSVGESTTDEMMLIYFYFLQYQTGDENIIVDTSTAVNTYNGCSFATSLSEIAHAFSPGVYPNPAIDAVVIDLPAGKTMNMDVFDTSGKLLKSFDQLKDDFMLDISGWDSGVYQFLFEDKTSRVRRSLVVKR